MKHVLTASLDTFGRSLKETLQNATFFKPIIHRCYIHFGDAAVVPIQRFAFKEKKKAPLSPKEVKSLQSSESRRYRERERARSHARFMELTYTLYSTVVY